MSDSDSSCSLPPQLVTLLRVVVDVNLPEAQALFESKAQTTATDAGRWSELVYCLLAGTQVPIEKARAAHNALFLPENVDRIALSTIAENPQPSAGWIASELRSAGYRYHTTKAQSVVSAAVFFQRNYQGRLGVFLQSDDPLVLRHLLARDVKGMGIKIASHWLRNTGAPIATVDIHIRRFIEGAILQMPPPAGGEAALSTAMFISYEQLLRDAAECLSLPLPVFQFSIWLYARENCSRHVCSQCSFLGACSRSHATLF